MSPKRTDCSQRDTAGEADRAMLSKNTKRKRKAGMKPVTNPAMLCAAQCTECEQTSDSAFSSRLYGDSAEMPVITVDVETRAVQVSTRRYERLGEHHWRHTASEDGAVVEFDVDDYGLVIDQPGRFRRQP